MLTIIRAGITTGGTNLPFIAQIPRWFPGDPRPQFWSPASASTDVSTVLSVHSMRNRLRPAALLCGFYSGLFPLLQQAVRLSREVARRGREPRLFARVC